MRLENKVALITGAAHGVTGEVKGFGGVAARMFAEEGAKVVLTDIDTDSGERTAAELQADGRDVVFVKLDVTSESDWENAINATVSAYGGAGHPGKQRGIGGASRVEDTTEEAWDLQMDIHAKGVFLGTRYAIPLMRAAGGGSIINISSIYGIVGKTYLQRVPRAKGRDTHIHQVRRHPACAGQHQGQLGASRLHGDPYDDGSFGSQDAERRQYVLSRIPMGRIGEPEEIAQGYCSSRRTTRPT